MIHPSCPVSPSKSLSQERTGDVSQDCSPSKAAALAAAANSSLPSLQDAATESQRDGSESSDGGSSNAVVKKAVWNKPNGAMEAGPVMGALSWPALSESTKASPKSIPYESSKPSPSDFPAASSKNTAASSSSPKHVHTHNSATNTTANHVHTRNKSNKRTGGNSSNSALANGGISQPHPLYGSVVDSAPHTVGKSNVESYSRDNMHKEGGQMGGFGPHDQHYMRMSPRKGVNSRPRPRGEGSYHQERGNQDWNHNRNFGGRDTHLQPLRAPARPFLRAPPPPSPPFIPPLIPMRPLGTPMVYPEVPAPPMYYVPGPLPDSPAMPMLPSPQHGLPVFYHVLDPMLLSKIVNQIDYYFSSENLVKDMFLRKEMDEQGWVPVKLIAGFKKVKELTDDIQLILNALRSSNVVEVQGEKLRARNDWSRWILPPTVQYAAISSPRGGGPEVLRQHLQSIKLDEPYPTTTTTAASCSRV